MTADLPTLQAALLKQLTDSGALTDPAVANAFRAVPRHLFLPDLPLPEVYQDEAIPTKMEDGRAISSSSQPAMMAIMLEQLGLAPGQSILEIGAGTGYNAALMGHLVGPGGRVVTVDIDQDLVDAANEHLAAAGAANVQAVQGDGGLGYPLAAPYDHVILTVGAWDIAPAWIDQLKPGGLLVLPLALGAGPQKSIAFQKAADAQPGEPLLTSLSLRDCGFMRLRGAFAGPEQLVALGPEPGLLLSTASAGGQSVPPENFYAWLTGPYQDTRTGLQITPHEVPPSLSFWVSVHEPQACELLVDKESPLRPQAACLFEYQGFRAGCMSLGVLDPAGLCLLWLAPARLLAKDNPDAPRELWIRAYGPVSRAAVQATLQGHLNNWHSAGRPGTPGMRVRVYPLAKQPPAVPGTVQVTKRWTTLVIDWPGA